MSGLAAQSNWVAHSEWDYQRAAHLTPLADSWASPLANWWVAKYWLAVELDKRAA
jgi:hypothetical protein